MQLNEKRNAGVFDICIEPETQEAYYFVDGRVENDVINFHTEILTLQL